MMIKLEKISSTKTLQAKEQAPQGPGVSVQRPGVGWGLSSAPEADPWKKVWGSQPSRSENQKPLPYNGGQMQKQQPQQAARSGKEPFSNWGVAKHPGLPACRWVTLPQPAPTSCPSQGGCQTS